MRSLPWTLASVLGAGVVLGGLEVGCGGKAVVDAVDGDGGAGGVTAGPGPGPTTSTSTSMIVTGPSGCMRHEDCASGLCLFGSGVCGEPCMQASCDTCGSGEICDGCATSSCPTCKDCMAACVAVGPGQCDDHDDCDVEQVCLFGEQRCAPRCDSAGGCADPNLVCGGCATSSCPCCEDCQNACLPL